MGRDILYVMAVDGHIEALRTGHLKGLTRLSPGGQFPRQRRYSRKGRLVRPQSPAQLAAVARETEGKCAGLALARLVGYFTIILNGSKGRPAATPQSRWRYGDRKSTRLNSSH